MSFLENLGSEYLEEQYRQWQDNPEQLGDDWRAFFQGFELGVNKLPGGQTASLSDALKQSGVQSLLYRYRSIGHLIACTDPLSACPETHPQLELAEFGLSEDDLDTTFITRRFHKEQATLQDILDTLRNTYCGCIGVEFMHIQDPVERQWLIDRMEPNRNRTEFDAEKRLTILKRLQEATLFEAFLHKKFLGQKRFSLEGGEAIIPLLDALVRHAADSGVKDLVMGMAHRGRLNVLANIFNKPLENIFAEFKDNLELGFVGDGDVKYHKGYSNDIALDDKKIHLTLAANPSHLEAVDPVVIGKSRARHVGYGPGGKKQVVPVLIHGDAAFAGQGIVTEVLNLSQLDGYQSGGTFHVVLNNQIGFTTEPTHARSTLYATDVAKMLSVPIFHVNGEDPEAVVHTAQLALDYRQKFGKDVVVEVICYRRHGHNEGDEPFFTQPLMYERIRKRPPLHDVYGERLIAAGFNRDTLQQQSDAIQQRLEEALESEPKKPQLGFSSKWEGIQRDYALEETNTAVEASRLQKLAEKMTTVPDSFNAHKKIAKLLDRRRESVLGDSGIDWGTAEHLAFASLLTEKAPVRLSGQDSRRGTFNQRHSTLVDQKTAQLYVPLAFLEKGQADIQIYNSMLSEAAVLGFEYGYSLETPHGLTIWEAQFGDFVNGAQVIIDQFIAGSGTKWDRSSGLVMFLPHGYEGQGPEHSSARIERFLALCADNNMLVANPSTPAQLFHLLRRQVKLSYRRPLVVFTPKSLLRHPRCVSSLDDFSGGSFSHTLLEGQEPGKCKALVACSGKIYYDLIEHLDEKSPDVAILRLEQLYPLRCEELNELSQQLPDKAKLFWLQEESQNMGAWSYLAPQLECLFGRKVEYFGRKASAAPAVGSHRRHQQEQQELLNKLTEAINGNA